MASTLASLVSKFNTEMKVNPNQGVWGQEIVEQLINSAYKHIQVNGTYQWEECSANTTLSAAQEITLPTNFVRLELVKALPDTVLGTTNKVTLVAQNTDFTITGKPSVYYIRGNVIGFDKTPNTSIEIYYRKSLETMTSTQDSELPESFDDAIVKYAAYLGWSQIRRNDDEAAIKLNAYELVSQELFSQQDEVINSFTYERITDGSQYREKGIGINQY